jgi:hypothetical protein
MGLRFVNKPYKGASVNEGTQDTNQCKSYNNTFGAKATNQPKPYTFKVRDTSQIDFDKILAELSYAQPLALVQVGKHVYFVIHGSILAKESKCVETPKLEYNVWRGTDKHISKIIAYVKWVKSASYISPNLEQTTEVVVTLPKI